MPLNKETKPTSIEKTKLKDTYNNSDKLILSEWF